jgi:HD-GYP domain-containing protein (c-di-GMP phosphodiesterase class II)
MKLHLENQRFCYVLVLFATSTLFSVLFLFLMPHPILNNIFPALFLFSFIFLLYTKKQHHHAKIKAQKDLENTVEILSRLLYSKDQTTVRHTQRVREYAEIIAKYAGASKEEIKEIGMAAKLHDLGKIFVKEDVLRKRSSLTQEEYEHMKTHVKLDQVVEPLLKANLPIAKILDVARLHHERFDGKGYPLGLKGEAIPFASRVIAVADAWDAMTSWRVYRNAMPEEKALEILKSGSGSQWDPKIVEAFTKAYEAGEIKKVKENHRMWIVKKQKQTLEKFESLLVMGA